MSRLTSVVPADTVSGARMPGRRCSQDTPPRPDTGGRERKRAGPKAGPETSASADQLFGYAVMFSAGSISPKQA